MKRVTVHLLCGLFLCVAIVGYAEEYTRVLFTASFTTGTERVTVTKPVRGFVEEIIADTDTGVTNTIQLYAQPEIKSMATFDLLPATTLTGDLRRRPVVPTTTLGGATTNTSTKILLVGEIVTMIVTNISVTADNTVRLIIKTSKSN